LNAEEIKTMLTKRNLPEPKVEKADLLSTGSTVLNMACTGDPTGGYVKGHYFFYVGDSDSGKSWLMLSALAEASINPEFDEYRLIYDNVENKALMDVKHFFGRKLADRLKPPASDDNGNPVCSRTTEEFYYHLHDLLEQGPCIYVLDSQDGLSSVMEEEGFEKRKAAHEKSKAAPGIMSDGKAKVHSANLRRILGPLRDTRSILLIVNQTRDTMSLFEGKSYSGGHALKFYSTLQLWSAVDGQIERQYRGKKRQIGVRCKIKVRKNHVTGRGRTVVIPILHASGVDDVGSCVDWLVAEGVWKSEKGRITVSGLGPQFSGNREQVVEEIEGREMEDDLRELLAREWKDIDCNSGVKRKPRYG